MRIPGTHLFHVAGQFSSRMLVISRWRTDVRLTVLARTSPSLLGNGALVGGFEASSAGGVVSLSSAGLLEVEGEGDGASGTFDADLLVGVGASGTFDAGLFAGAGAFGTLPDFVAGLSPGKVVSVLGLDPAQKPVAEHKSPAQVATPHPDILALFRKSFS